MLHWHLVIDVPLNSVMKDEEKNYLLHIFCVYGPDTQNICTRRLARHTEYLHGQKHKIGDDCLNVPGETRAGGISLTGG